MGDESSAESGGGTKPDANNSQGRQGGRHGKGKKKNNANAYASDKEKAFAGQSDKIGVFTAQPNHGARASGTAQYTETHKSIVTYAADAYNSRCSKSIAKGKLILPTKPDENDYVTNVKDKDGAEVSTLTEAGKVRYTKACERWEKQVEEIKESLRCVYQIVWNNCDPTVQATLKEAEDFDDMDDEMDVLELLARIKSLTFKGTATTDPIYSIVMMMKEVFTTRQGKKMTVSKFNDDFTSIIKAADGMFGGTGKFLAIFDSLLTTVIATENGETVTGDNAINDDKQKEYAKQGRDRMAAMMFTLGTDRSRYGDTVDQMQQDFLKGNNSYPNKQTAAYTLFRNVKVKNSQPRYQDRDDDGHQFNVNGEESGGSGAGNRLCFRCGRPGHIAAKCSEAKHVDGNVLHTMGEVAEESSPPADDGIDDDVPDDGSVEVSGTAAEDFLFCSVGNQALMLYQSGFSANSTNSRGGIPDTWILLDSQSSIDVFCNSKLLRGIYKSKATLTIRCNAGVRTTSMRGYLPNYGWVWYYSAGIANILSLSRVKQQFRVTYDSANGNCFQVHKNDGEILNFHEGPRRLYYHDMRNRSTEQCLLVNTVANNLKHFSAQDVDRAKKAHKLQVIIGRPSNEDYNWYIKENFIKDCPVTNRDIRTAKFIWGERERGDLQGKTPWRKPRQIRVDHTNIPPQIMQHYRDITLCVDVMKVATVPFLMTICKHIKFGSAGRLLDMTNETIIKHFKKIVGAYSIRGFKVTIMIGDGQFESMRGEICDLGVHLHVVANNDHVPDNERFIRTIKERVRCDWAIMPFKHVPPSVVAQLVYRAVFWRNAFPLKTGISRTLSPGEIILNRKVSFTSHCKLVPFQYVHTHEEHDNSMTPRTVGAIAFKPTGDGSAHVFISLQTGRALTRSNWTELPLPDDAIDRMHTLARRARAATTLTFTNRDNIDLDTLYADLDRDEDDLPLTALTAGVADDDTDDEDDEDFEPTSDSESNSESNSDDDDDSGSEDENDDDDDNEDGESAGVQLEQEDKESTGVQLEHENEQSEGVQSAGVHLNEENNDEERSDADECLGDDEDDQPDNDVAAEGGETPADESNLRRSARPTRGMNSKFDDYVMVASGTINVVSPAEFRKGGQMMSESTNLLSPSMFSRGAIDVATATGMLRKGTGRKPTQVACNVFATCGDELRDDDQILLLNINAGSNNGYDESVMAQTDAEWMFLTQHLGWGEGLKGDKHGIEQEEEYLFTTDQMNWKKGLKVFGEKGEEAIQKELQQIHDMEGFQPKHWYELTKEERADALKYLMYLKEKRDGRIKGRGCADGRKQRAYIPKAEASSPTATLMGIMLTCMIDAYEKRDVATVDIPGAFLQTKVPKDDRDIHVVLDGRMAELLAKISPEDYQKFVHQYRGQSHIYCKLNVSLYGTLKAALLFWKKLSGYLKEQGFTVNPYDWCVANKIVNGKTCTIVWHVDDLKISHADSSVVDDVIESLRSEFGKVGELTVNRGKVHEYLGMELDFSDENSFTVSMEKYFDEVLKDLPEDMDGTAVSPAAEHLFKTRDDVAKLDEERAALFHRVTAQLLFASQRARPDLRTAVSFLTKRVQSPDEDDYKKLARAIKYVRRTKFLRLKVEAHRLDKNHWFIDGAFAVHPDMKSHTGAYMTFGKGMVNGTSSAQKINTTSSTEAEVVAVHDNMPAILWTRYFMEAQGYPMKPSVVHQDNQSAILLGTNGKGSSGKRTRHMNIRYFFVADVQERKQITMEYCPTDEMIGDFFTKPLQGAKFRRFRNIIMNITEDENGPVDIDEIMEIHYKKMEARLEHTGIEPKDKKCDASLTEVSQECVGRKIQDNDRTMSWADAVKSGKQ